MRPLNRIGAKRVRLTEALPRAIAGTFATAVVMAAFNVVSGAVLARTLGPADRGILAFILLWPQLVSTLGNLGVDLATTHFSADRDRGQRAAATAFRIAIFQSVALGAIYLSLVSLLPGTAHAGWAALVVGALIPVDLVALYASGAFQGRLDFRSFNVVRVLMAPTYAFLVVGLRAGSVLSFETAGVAYVAANAVLAVVGLVLLNRRHGRQRPDWALVRPLLRFGVRAHLGRLSVQSLGVDVAVIGLVLAPRELGLYVAAAAFLTAPAMVSGAVSAVLYPIASAAHFGHRAAPVQTLLAVTIATNAVLVAVLALVAPFIVNLVFGSAFAGAATVLRALLAGEIAKTTYQLLNDAVRGAGGAVVTTQARLVDWPLFVGGALIGAVFGGVVGAGIGIACAAYASLAGLVFLIRRGGLLGTVMRAPRLSTARAGALA